MEGNDVVLYDRKNGANQRWKIVYTDEKGAEMEKKGLDTDFGFYRGRAFYIVSNLPMKRVLEVSGSNIVIKMKQYQRTQQQFEFNFKTKTIESVSNKGKSISIQSSGAGANLQIENTNARWW